MRRRRSQRMRSRSNMRRRRSQRMRSRSNMRRRRSQRSRSRSQDREGGAREEGEGAKGGGEEAR